MKKIQLALVGALALGTGFVQPSMAQTPHKHHKLATAAAGIVAYEAAKHSHNRFLHKHRFAAGIVGAMAAHHYMKKKDQHGH